MNSIDLYPVFLNLSGRLCVVAGLGSVGCRKLAGLIDSGADEILALDMRKKEFLSEEAARLIGKRQVKFENRAFTPSDAAASFLVFAATSDLKENLRIANLCRQERSLCNCITAPDAGDFILPATARQGMLCAALSTTGQSPFLARQWRLELEDWLKPREKLAWLMGRLRGPVLALGNEQSHNSMIFRKIAQSPIALWLDQGEIGKCRQWLEAELPQELHQELALIFDGYADAFA